MTDQRGELRRSVWYLIGKYEALEAALNGSPDAVVFDFEDSVPTSEKPTARQKLRSVLEESRCPAPVYIRVNKVSGPLIREDLSVVRSGLHGVVYAKAERVEEIAELDRLVSERERATGMVPGTIDLEVTIESCLGLMNAYSLALASPRVKTISFGGTDFRADLGVRRTVEGKEVLWAKSLLIMAAKAANVLAIDTAYTSNDPDGYVREAEECFTIGFDGKKVVDVDQVEQNRRLYAKLRVPRAG